MACFLVPTAEAIVTGVVSKVEKKNEVVAEGKIPFSRGVTMALLVTAAWGCIALAADKIVKRESGVAPAVR